MSTQLHKQILERSRRPHRIRRPEPTRRAVHTGHDQPRPSPRQATRTRRHQGVPRNRRPTQVPRPRVEELTVVAEGPYVVQFGRQGGRWPGGSFLGIDAAAGSYSRDFMAAYRFSDGQIAERWAIRDDLAMLRQAAQ